jgi:flagellin
LSSGLRINRAGDDAAGLAISEKMRAQIRGLNNASKNATDGISLIQTAEGAMGSMHSMLQRIRELSVYAGNGTLTDDDRNMIATEMSQLGNEIDNVISNTEFNTQKLLIGANAPITLQIGANCGQTMGILINKANLPQSLLIFGAAYQFADVHVDLSTPGNSDIVLNNVDTLIDNLSTERSSLGAIQNRLEHTINNLNTASENITAAESRIRDTDMSKEIVELTKNQILSSAGTSMLAQANQQSQSVLALLQSI